MVTYIWLVMDLHMEDEPQLCHNAIHEIPYDMCLFYNPPFNPIHIYLTSEPKMYQHTPMGYTLH